MRIERPKNWKRWETLVCLCIMTYIVLQFYMDEGVFFVDSLVLLCFSQQFSIWFKNPGSWALSSLPTCGGGTRILSQVEEENKTHRRDASSKVTYENSFCKVLFVFFFWGFIAAELGTGKKKVEHLYSHLWQIPCCNSQFINCFKIILEFWEGLYFGTRCIFMIFRMLFCGN